MTREKLKQKSKLVESESTSMIHSLELSLLVIKEYFSVSMKMQYSHLDANFSFSKGHFTLNLINRNEVTDEIALCKIVSI